MLPKIFYRRKTTKIDEKGKEELKKILEAISEKFQFGNTGAINEGIDNGEFSELIQALLDKYPEIRPESKTELILDFIFIFLSLLAISLLFGFFTGLEENGISFVYIFSLTVIIAIFSALNFKLKFEKAGIFIGIEKNDDQETNYPLVGTAIILFVLGCFFSYGYGNKYRTYGSLNFSKETFWPYKKPYNLDLQSNLSTIGDLKKIKGWIDFGDSLIVSGYDSASVGQLINSAIKNASKVDSLSRKIKQLENNNLESMSILNKSAWPNSVKTEIYILKKLNSK
jgi:hypothetical protein